MAFSKSAGAVAPTMEELNPATMGVMSTHWAIIMASTVKSSLNEPRGPLRERSRNTNKPATTGGSPIKVCNTRMSIVLPRKFVLPKSTPKGMPRRQEIVVLVKDILIVTPIICHSSLSKEKTRRKASRKASI